MKKNPKIFFLDILPLSFKDLGIQRKNISTLSFEDLGKQRNIEMPKGQDKNLHIFVNDSSLDI